MPFRVKNTGETYHKLVNTIFKYLTKKKVDVYIGDIVVKSTMYTGNLYELQDICHYRLQWNEAKPINFHLG